jgi:hypothetical protein
MSFTRHQAKWAVFMYKKNRFFIVAGRFIRPETIPQADVGNRTRSCVLKQNVTSSDQNDMQPQIII